MALGVWERRSERRLRGHKKKATETDGLRIAGGGSARDNYNTQMGKKEGRRKKKEERTEREIERDRKEGGGGLVGSENLKQLSFPGPPEACSVQVGCVKFSAAICHRPHYVGKQLPTY